MSAMISISIGVSISVVILMIYTIPGRNREEMENFQGHTNSDLTFALSSFERGAFGGAGHVSTDSESARLPACDMIDRGAQGGFVMPLPLNDPPIKRAGHERLLLGALFGIAEPANAFNDLLFDLDADNDEAHVMVFYRSLVDGLGVGGISLTCGERESKVFTPFASLQSCAVHLASLTSTTPIELPTIPNAPAAALLFSPMNIGESVQDMDMSGSITFSQSSIGSSELTMLGARVWSDGRAINGFQMFFRSNDI